MRRGGKEGKVNVVRVAVSVARNAYIQSPARKLVLGLGGLLESVKPGEGGHPSPGEVGEKSCCWSGMP